MRRGCSTEREEQTVGDDASTGRHDDEWNEHVGEKIDDVVRLLEECEVESGCVVRTDNHVFVRRLARISGRDDRSFRAHEEKNVTVDRAHRDAHGEKDSIG